MTYTVLHMHSIPLYPVCGCPGVVSLIVFAKMCPHYQLDSFSNIRNN